MNKCFFIGELEKKDELKFIYKEDKTHKSIIICNLKLLDGNIITVLGYDEIADYIYKKEPNLVLIYGTILENMQVEIIQIDTFYPSSNLDTLENI